MLLQAVTLLADTVKCVIYGIILKLSCSRCNIKKNANYMFIEKSFTVNIFPSDT